MSDDRLREAAATGMSIYRVSKGADRWGRRWQAEWGDCMWCPRAWTRKGVVKKAIRWRVNATDIIRSLRKYGRRMKMGQEP